MTHLPLINGTTRHTANICRKTVQIGNNIVNHSFISFSQILINTFIKVWGQAEGSDGNNCSQN